MRLRRSTYVSGLLWLVGTYAGAEDYVLFRATAEIDRMWSSDPDPAYDHTVTQLKAGDRITFSNGKTFEIDGLLGQGNTSLILGVKGNPPQALRIPQGISWFARSNDSQGRRLVLTGAVGNPSLYGEPYSRDFYHLRSFVDFMIEGYPELIAHGVDTVEIYDSLPGEYVLVERLPPTSLPLRPFLMQREGDAHFEERAQKLVTFARKTADFSSIGDFNDSQLLYNPERRRWVLADWTQKHIAVDFRQGKIFDSIFKQLKVLPPDRTHLHQRQIKHLELDINKTIAEARREHAQEWFRSTAKSCLSRLLFGASGPIP